MKISKNIKVKISTKPNIHIGDHFIYKDMNWVCLDVIDGNYLSITTSVWKKLPFDVDNRNNWKESSLRKVLNEEFLDKLDKNYLVTQTSNLIADNGDKQYGTCNDYVTILSCDQYRKYRNLVPCYPEWMWTLTPWNCYSDNGGDDYSIHGVRNVHPNGYIVTCGACIGIGVAPVVLFSHQQLNQLWESCYK